MDLLGGKSCMTNLIGFCDQTTGLMNEERAVDVIYLDFSQAFEPISHNILIDKLVKCGLDKRAVDQNLTELSGPEGYDQQHKDHLEASQ
ncbi:rna-directed dna polymerase from mobile element jockey- hypothetical protein [Limosa lapponica baueri]|uniref:Rna-directed dna polymerase from mobile element jockey-like n=1 Tax=Limosa lapponica baueri TaxID=1758121 RepID=A0A2I0UKN5_LIMLA|nr:rna-directed dna polymerase from mobile element jockey- hypothetical protein [Limosa lapponica baueri]